MNYQRWIIVLALCSAAIVSQAQPATDDINSRTYQATRTTQTPTIDGVLDDDCWQERRYLVGKLRTATS